MADTPEEAVALHVKAVGDTREIKMADTIHLPFQHYSAGAEWVFQWNTPEDVPDYMEMLDPKWAGTSCKLKDLQVICASDRKIAYRVLATRFHADGTPMQDFEAIYSVLKKGEDWRVVNRNPINVFPA